MRWSDALIADAQGIADYYRTKFDADHRADLLRRAAVDRADRPARRAGSHPRRLPPGRRAVRAGEPRRRHRRRLPSQPARRCRWSSSAPRRTPTSTPASVHALADDRVRFLGGVWDQELLDQLYANALTYLHGHSVGGTNPSLLRAIGAGAATIAFDVVFNREVLGDAGRYFATAERRARAVRDAASAIRPASAGRGRPPARGPRSTTGTWSPTSYEDLCRRLAARRVAGRSARSRELVRADCRAGS